MMADANGMIAEPTSPNLKHIYFFLGDAGDSAPDIGKATFTSGMLASLTCEPSPSSLASGSSTKTASMSDSEMNPLAAEFKPQAEHKVAGGAPPEPTASNFYELRGTMDRGFGLFATALIKRGTRIICEKPLLEISQSALPQVWGRYCRLSDAAKVTYDSLHSFTPDASNLEKASGHYLIDPDDTSLNEDDIKNHVASQVRVMSTFAVNCFQVPPEGHAVYATASRLNHSCVPNVHHSYNPTLKSITVHAVRDILPGQELLTSYLGSPGTYQSRTQRVEILLTTYGFICACPACTDPSGASEAERHLMASLSWGLLQLKQGNAGPHPFIPTTPLAALQHAEDLVSVMIGHGIFTIELAKAYRLASVAALDLKDFDRALEYGHNEAVVERNCLGTEIKDLRRIGAATETWLEWIYQVIRAEKGEEAVIMYRGAAKGEKRKWKKKSGNKRLAKKDVAEDGAVAKGGETME